MNISICCNLKAVDYWVTTTVIWWRFLTIRTVSEGMLSHLHDNTYSLTIACYNYSMFSQFNHKPNSPTVMLIIFFLSYFLILSLSILPRPLPPFLPPSPSLLHPPHLPLSPTLSILIWLCAGHCPCVVVAQHTSSDRQRASAGSLGHEATPGQSV